MTCSDGRSAGSTYRDNACASRRRMRAPRGFLRGRLRGSCFAAVAAIIGSLAWTGSAGAETLIDALTKAYLNNPTLLAQRAQLRATDELVPQALSGYRPTVTGNASAGKSRNNSSPSFAGGIQNRSPRTLSLNLRQPLFRGFRTLSETNQAQNTVLAERARLLSVEQDVLFAAATSFVDVVRDQAVLELNIGNEQVLRRQLEATRDRFEVGEVTRTDVSQAEARLARAVADRVQAEGSLEISRAVYRNIIGESPGKLAQPGKIEQVPGSLNETIELARETNPSVVAARFAEMASRDGVDLIAGELLPTLSLNGDLSRNLSTSTRGSRSSAASIVAQITVPLYQAGAVTSRVRAAKQVASQRRIQIMEARRDAAENGSRAWENLKTAQARIGAFEAETRANEIALEGVKQEASAGLRTVLDVLDAEQELLDARVNLVRARRDGVVAGFELQSAVGWLSSERLALPVDPYDVEKHYDKVRNKVWGLGDSLPGAEK